LPCRAACLVRSSLDTRSGDWHLAFAAPSLMVNFGGWVMARSIRKRGTGSSSRNRWKGRFRSYLGGREGRPDQLERSDGVPRRKEKLVRVLLPRWRAAARRLHCHDSSYRPKPPRRATARPTLLPLPISVSRLTPGAGRGVTARIFGMRWCNRLNSKPVTRNANRCPLLHEMRRLGGAAFGGSSLPGASTPAAHGHGS
jgi:hypothetical protein